MLKRKNRLFYYAKAMDSLEPIRQKSRRDFDLANEVIDIVRQTILSGLVTTVTLKEFDKAVKSYSDEKLEDYIQGLWDVVPS